MVIRKIQQRLLNLLFISVKIRKMEFSVKNGNAPLSTPFMNNRNCSSHFLASFLFLLLLAACNNKRHNPGAVIAHSPQEVQLKATDIIRNFIDYAISNNNKIDDSTALRQLPIAQMLYEKNQYNLNWSKEEKWLPLGDSLYNFIANAKLCGLFPGDYHINHLTEIRSMFLNDSNAKGDRKNVTLWSEADLMLTNAFIQIVKDVKLGRLSRDSITLRKDSVLTNEFYLGQFDSLKQSGSLSQMIQSLEPKQIGYQLLKAGIKKFLDSADNRQFTFVPAPGSDARKWRSSSRRMSVRFPHLRALRLPSVMAW